MTETKLGDRPPTRARSRRRVAAAIAVPLAARAGRPSTRRARRAADGELADERRQLVQPTLLAADGDRPQQRREPQRRVAHAPRRLRRRHAVLGRSAADRLRRRHLRADGRRATCLRSASSAARFSGSTRANLDEANDVVCCGWTSRGVAHGDGHIFSASSTASSSRSSEDRQRRLGGASRALARRLHDHERAALLRRPRHHGLRGRRVRHSRPRQSVRRARAASSSGRSTRSRAAASSATTRGRKTTSSGSTAAARLAHAGPRSRARTHLFLHG